MRIRRSHAVAMRYEHVQVPGLGPLGQPANRLEERLVAVSALTGQMCVVDEQTLRALSYVPSSAWVELTDVVTRVGVHPSWVTGLLNAGLLVCDASVGPWAELARRDERFAATDWYEGAAQYHMQSRVRDQHAAGVPGARREAASAEEAQVALVREMEALAENMDEAMQAHATHRGPPPPPFHEVPGAMSRHGLPDPRLDTPLTRLLTARKTIRVFDAVDPMNAQELSTVLYYVYGAQSVAEPAPGHVSIRKTSPSGGSLHPIEAYPLVINVRGVPPGLYHYSVRSHMLELMRPMTRAEAEQLAEVFVLGQSYFRSANAMVLLTARWFRSFWKYPRAHKAYRVVHLDAGHLSQTAYLMCEQLGLGAFFTGAVNDVNIEETLGLDPLQEGVIGISGFGRALDGGYPLTLETAPYTPRT